MLECGDGNYAKDNVCKKCSTNCATCVTSDINCLTCNETTLYKLLQATKCVVDCEDTFYKKNDTHCEKCEAKCATCSSYPECDTCLGSYKYYNHSCYDECPMYTYLYDGVNCKECSPGCKSCPGGSPCTLCNEPRFLLDATKGTCYCSSPPYFDELIQNCTDTCPIGYTADAVNHVCQKCQVSCMTCDTNVTCTGSTCNGTYVWNTAHNLCICENPTVSSFYNLQLETCQAVCTQGYYGDTTTGVCEKCHEFCAKCADDTNENCELCATDIYRLDTLKCVDSCPADTHVANSGTYVCDPCESPCLNCLSSTTSCTVCIPNTFLDDQKKCNETCPDAFWEKDSLEPLVKGGVCDPCNDKCLLCEGGNTLEKCTKCKMTSELFFYETKGCIPRC